MHREHLFKHVLFFLQVSRFQSRCCTCAWIPSSVHDVPPVVMLGLVQQRLDPRLYEHPCTRIEWLLLTPHDVLGVWIRIEILLELGPREWIQLLDPCDSGILNALRFSVLDEGSVDLSRAQNNALDLVMRCNRLAVFGFWDDPLEVSILSEVLDVGSGNRMPQE